MNQRIAAYVTEKFVKNGIVTEKDKALYQYGVSQGVVIIFNILTTIFIGALFGMIWESMLFLLAFIPIRIYAGGYHAGSQIKCYIMSSLMIMLAMLDCKLIAVCSAAGFAEALAGALLLLAFAPVADKNKPITEDERSAYRRITQLFLLGELMMTAVFYCCSQSREFHALAAAVFFLGGIVTAGKIKNSVKKGIN